MFWEKKLAQWVDDVRTKTNLPARLVLWNGEQHDFGSFAAPQVTLKVNTASALPLLLDPSLDNLGEAYVKGKIDIEGKLSDIINIGYSLARSTVTNASKLARVRRYFNHTKTSDKKAIQYHYDVSNEFYRLWLDENMVYSCAYFENGDEDLATAQLKKIDHILTKIQVQPGQRLLDIGCGWGALVLRAAQKFGARCVGVTLSQNQFDLATERVRAAGLADRIEIRLQDYRDVQGQFDRITSVGMFEHVGRKNLPGYFGKIRELLADDGVAMNHGITSSDYDSGETALGGGEFIDRYVFPDGELPHISLALESMQRGGLEAVDVESLRRHYARTLDIWTENFEAHAEQARKLVDDEKFRIWRVYLAGCSYAFEHDDVSIYQVVCRKAGGSAKSLPWSRRYMYDRPL
ncbi:cyclopropane-fatty-acyl-phospholipid synthase family protein [Trinickia caryophylli]|uniref:Cyclopropane-fatty-acyl-phospholipid synthase n=1 Tax=Trinickia caryophylli TaxID=28094 RepID=A0A1X7H2G9_TRICW|nr:cyclopropane-fatty-acyl-phospholipid synthase family protein [Trinickia caryophylli]PMS10028.1 class I SAM-dependent methyltransferase [Trinickia caryophylli]TRX18384.1 class I SAM-dependent methyltransferase [Trinickia caryophylli]WQE10832.1 cyclopropane-fatty-acyl-phospholipid synthase family protein [Trinickia caryophylli]SMF78471.1 cyclopropane-fatty-acyl-phospholipid synthase [Trinickia caryophylli]GLU35473.1 cyclopropane-fatty-acyl-phospholipid synthase [Trinickia caryophylli]